jgi:hypothetical protein
VRAMLRGSTVAVISRGCAMSYGVARLE